MPAPARAFAWGLLGGCLAGLVSLLPALGAPALSPRVAGYAGLIVGLVVIRFGTEKTPGAGASFGQRLALAGLLVTTLAAVTAAALCLEFTWLRPELLSERYAGYQALVRASAVAPATVAAELARLASHRAEYLSAGYQALSDASALFFFGMLLGAYGAWRERTRERWLRRQGERTEPPRA